MSRDAQPVALSCVGHLCKTHDNDEENAYAMYGEWEWRDDVLQSVQSYWSSIFVLSKKVIKQIDALCRKFLWEGSTNSTHAPPVAWDRVCSSKKAGGLGLKNLACWNMAAVGKLAWWVVTKADRLWVQWVHHVYLKGFQWADYTVGVNSSWSWRRICKIMTVFKLGFTTVWCPNNKLYTVTGGYAWLKQEDTRVRWHNVIWNRYACPKHTFISWLCVQGRLYTNARQLRLGLHVNAACFLSGVGTEDHDHLFFRCPTSRRCLALVQRWLGRPVGEDWNWIFLKQMRDGPMLVRLILYAAFSGLIHHVWDMRNVFRIHHYVKSPVCTVRDLKFELKVRIESFNCNWKASDREWLCSINLI
ncbi:hypothetical protein RND81_02G167200 [Saponaria officinalis]|uniref:Reverse transcriptase zinc-binding domain-containing protein n=1 Tax=Saponaria officinalis TaxID=3572 RepID=A0AAW1MVZ1_SAPOF